MVTHMSRTVLSGESGLAPPEPSHQPSHETFARCYAALVASSQQENLSANILRGGAGIESLTKLHASLSSRGDVAHLRALAASLPTSLVHLPPEIAFELSKIAMELAAYGPVFATDVLELAPSLRRDWLRAYLCAGYDSSLISEEILLQVCEGWDLEPLAHPADLLSTTAVATDPRLRLVAIRCIPSAVTSFGITKDVAFQRLHGLCGDEEPYIRKLAIDVLARPCLRTLRPADERERVAVLERALRTDHEPTVSAACSAASSLGYAETLRSVAFDESVSLATRRLLLPAIGEFATHEDIEVVLAIALHDSRSFANPARRFFLAAHRRGVFADASHVPQLLELFDEGCDWTGEELWRIAYVVREELMRELDKTPPNSMVWVRRSEILSASHTPQAARLLSRLLEQCMSEPVAVFLVRAAGACAQFQDEEALLHWLDRLPEDVLPVLRCKGGPATQQALRSLALALHTAPGLRKSACEVLWALSPSRSELQRELAATLGPRESGLLDSGRTHERDTLVATLVEEAPWQDIAANRVAPDTRFRLMCESGNLEFRAAVTTLFRELFEDLVAKALQGDFTAKRILLPSLEQQLFRYGRHLAAAGRCVRFWTADAPETGRDFVLSTVLAWLGETPNPATTVALLEVVARHAPSGAVLRAIEPYWRHKHTGVQRAGLEAILAAGEGARGLELSICRLVEGGDARILCQALVGVATLKAVWAEGMVASCLERPEMSVKKAAAEALAVIGGPASAPALVFWLGRHDNSGFRSSLKSALATCAKSSQVSVLVEALEATEDPRTTELLWDAISGLLTVRSVLALARSSESSARGALVQACLDSQVRVIGVSAEALAGRLHRAELLVQSVEDDPTSELRDQGFSPSAALRLLEKTTDDNRARVWDVVRASLAEWIGWIGSSEPPSVEAAELVFEAARTTNTEHIRQLFACIEALATKAPVASIVGWLERCVQSSVLGPSDRLQAIAYLRTAPSSSDVGGLCRYRLLGRLGAVRLPEDLNLALEYCRRRPDYAGESCTLLSEALQIPKKNDDESYDITSLRNEAEHWWQNDSASREMWLASIIQERPLDVAIAEPLPESSKSRFVPYSEEHRRTLLQGLQSPEEQERLRCATHLVDWPAGNGLRDVLSATLDGRFEATPKMLRRMATVCESWPTEEGRRRRALTLVPYLSPVQLRTFLPGWIADWRRGAKDTEVLMAPGPVQDELLRLVASAVAKQDYTLLALLRPRESVAQGALLAELEHVAPREIEHLTDTSGWEPSELEAPIDPIEGKSFDGLIEFLGDASTAVGLAVRAVHALTAFGEKAVEALDKLASDRRTKVRSAALRAMRTVASRERVLATTLVVLRMETRRDIVLRLMSSLGHARYEPGLTALLERLSHSDYRIRQGAHGALRAWGPSAIPAIHHASRKARPDRRPAYTALVADLTQ